MRRAWLLLLLLAACTPPPPQAPAPESEDYVYPAPANLTKSEQQHFDKAWRAILAGDSAGAERELRRLRDGSAPAVRTAFGYAQLRAGRTDEALATFSQVVQSAPRYGPALVGAGGAAARAGRIEEALALYARAIAAGERSPAERIPDLRLQVVDRRVAQAQEALGAGRADEAMEHYRVALQAAPEVSGVRLELANLMAQRGETTTAIGLLRGDPTGDPQLAVRVADLLAEGGDLPAALEAYRAVLARDPGNEAAQAGVARATQTLEFAGYPDEYREIFGSPRIDRADLAALVSMRVSALRRLPADPPPVAIDISGSWAREHILRALSYGLFDLYTNHTFQPMGTVRRSDLAVVLQRILDRAGSPAAAAPAMTDVPRTTALFYPASRAVGSGLMSLTPAGSFEGWRPVSGEEAVRALDALVRRLGN